MVRRKEEKRRPIIFVLRMGRMEKEKGDNLLGEGKRHRVNKIVLKLWTWKMIHSSYLSTVSTRDWVRHSV